MADRLLLFEGEVHSGLPALALRISLESGDIAGGARFLGHVEAKGVGISKEALAAARATIESGLSEPERAQLIAKGAAADYRQVLSWIRDL